MGGGGRICIDTADQGLDIEAFSKPRVTDSRVRVISGCILIYSVKNVIPPVNEYSFPQK